MPLQNDFSPAELLMRRKLQTTIPVFHTSPKWPDLRKLNYKETAYRQKQQDYSNTRHRAKPLPSLCKGQEVKITNQEKPGIVVKKRSV